MSDLSVTLENGASIASLQQRARFFRDDAGIDRIEISAVGSKDTIVKKVAPEHMARFKPEWDAHCDGRPMARRPGTALTDCPGINQDKADGYIARNIHNLEELAVLSDGQCQAVGHGTLTDRKHAQGLLASRKMERETAQRDAVSKAAGSIAAPVSAEGSKTEEIAALGVKIDAMADGINALVGLLTAQAEKKKPGPKPKAKPQE